MFEVGFFELAVIFGVALVVLGPARLPGLVRNVGRWVGKARSMARQFREQLESEVNVEELNRIARDATTNPPASRSSDAPASAPPSPAAAAADDAVAATRSDMASSGYPYGTPDPAPVDPESPPPPQYPDDYSHAHAAGDAPMPYNPDPADLGPADPHVVAHTEAPAPFDDGTAQNPDDRPAHS